MNIKDELGLNCKGNCIGACCRFHFVQLRNDDEARWFAYHGHRVFRVNPGGHLRGLVEIKCKMLTDDGKCSVFGTHKRPMLCDQFWCDDMLDYEEVKYEN